MGKTRKRQQKRETSGKDKPLTILMVQPWQKVAKQRITRTFSPETVISFPPLGEEDETEGPMIIEAEMGGHFVHRIYVDGGSSSEIMYEHCFNGFRLEIGDEEHSTYAWMNFMVVRSTIFIQRNHRKAMSSTLTQEGRKELYGLLRRNLDIFAWKPADMTRVSRHIPEHMLNIREGCLPVRQKKKRQAPERNMAIYKEVEKLVNVGIMKEVHYRSWLTNLVMVKSMTTAGECVWTLRT
nr:reverse transcriptase domain-containing protein [Tanacetum cinerariifolium]